MVKLGYLHKEKFDISKLNNEVIKLSFRYGNNKLL